MDTIKLLESIILLVELLPYDSTSKQEVLDYLKYRLALEKKYD